MSESFIDFIERSNAAPSIKELCQLFQDAVGQHGYERMCLAAVTPSAQKAFTNKEVGQALAVRCPEDWLAQYMTQRYYENDPILLAFPGQHAPYLWDEVLATGHFTAKQRLIVEQGREAGLHNGVAIPLYGPQGEGCLLTLATDNVQVDNRPILGHLHALAMQFYVAYGTLARNAPQTTVPLRLTARERECLTWTARGKSAWAIGMILGVSENTINFHLKSAMRRLGTTNRVQAVAVAMGSCLIQP